MRPRDAFGVVVRSFGIVLLLGGVIYSFSALAVMETPNAPGASPPSHYLRVAVLSFAIGVYFLRAHDNWSILHTMTNEDNRSTMKQSNVYVDLKGREFSLDKLTAAEKKLIAELKLAAKKADDWSSFSNLWTTKVSEFFADQGLTRPHIRQTAGYRIGQDLDSRFAISKGMTRHPDFRDELQALIEQRFRTRREFCEATGLSEDMLSHVLSKRKHLAVSTLEDSLRRIGYALHITPAVEG